MLALTTRHLPWLWTAMLIAGALAAASAGFVLLAEGVRVPSWRIILDWHAWFFWAVWGWGVLVLILGWRGRRRFHRLSYPARFACFVLSWAGLAIDWWMIFHYFR